MALMAGAASPVTIPAPMVKPAPMATPAMSQPMKSCCIFELPRIGRFPFDLLRWRAARGLGCRERRWGSEGLPGARVNCVAAGGRGRVHLEAAGPDVAGVVAPQVEDVVGVHASAH